MKSRKQSSFLINTALRFAGGLEMRRLRAASNFPAIAQAATLRAVLKAAKDSEIGLKYGFSAILDSVDDLELMARYRAAVPVSEYEDYRPYVNRMMEGEKDVLFKGSPLLYATTSGSTGEPKYVPVSEKYLDNVYGRMTRLWLFNFILHRKKVFAGKMLTVVGRRVEGHAPDGTVFGAVSGFTLAHAPEFIRNIYAVPSEVYDIEDYGARNYALMRFALEQNVTVWIAPNPSTILELQNTVEKWLDEMIDDIGNGTLCEKFVIPTKVRDALLRHARPNPERAFELRRLKAQYDRVLPCHYWPGLLLLSTWKCGNTRIYLQKLKNCFSPYTFHQELGYFATECRAGLVFDDSNESVLMPHMHYYEFKKESDLGDPDAPFYNLWELKAGTRYCMYVTTFSGLYRYNMNDIVQASTPFLNCSRVHMVQKVNGIVSITGEKLYEEQFIKAVAMAQESTGMKLSYYSGYVNLQESRYDWYFEFADRGVNRRKADAFAKVVDDNLKKLNIEYESKRNSFRLKDPKVFLLEKNAFDKFKAFILNRNHRDASRFKPNVLAQNEELHKVISKFTVHGKDGTSGESQ